MADTALDTSLPASDLAPAWEGDTGRLPVEGRRALTALLRYRTIGASVRGGTGGGGTPDDFQHYLDYRQTIDSILADMDLVVEVSEQYRVAWVMPAPAGRVRPTLSLKADRQQFTALTFGVAVLLLSRQHQLSCQGHERWFVDERELLEEVRQLLLPDTADGQRVLAQLRHSLSDLSEYEYLVRLDDVEGRWEITPALPAVFSTPALQQAIQDILETFQMTKDGVAHA